MFTGSHRVMQSRNFKQISRRIDPLQTTLREPSIVRGRVALSLRSAEIKLVVLRICVRSRSTHFPTIFYL